MNHHALEILDMKIFNDFADLMEDDLAMILTRHRDASEKYLGAIHEGIASQNFKAVAQAAHPFKSSSQQIGALKVADIAKSMEHLAKADVPDVTKLQLLSNELEVAHRATSKALSVYLEGAQARLG